MRRKFSKIFLGLIFLIASASISCKSTENPKGLGDYAGNYSVQTSDGTSYSITVGNDGSATVNGTQGTVTKISDTEYKISFDGKELTITFASDGSATVVVDGQTISTKKATATGTGIDSKYVGKWTATSIENPQFIFTIIIYDNGSMDLIYGADSPISYPADEIIKYGNSSYRYINISNETDSTGNQFLVTNIFDITFYETANSGTCSIISKYTATDIVVNEMIFNIQRQ